MRKFVSVLLSILVLFVLACPAMAAPAGGQEIDLTEWFHFNDDSQKNGNKQLESSDYDDYDDYGDDDDYDDDDAANPAQPYSQNEDENNYNINSGLNGARDDLENYIMNSDELRNAAAVVGFCFLFYLAVGLIGLVVMAIVLGVRLSHEKREIFQHRQSDLNNEPFHS